MKKLLFMVAVTAVALSSCSKNEVVPAPENTTDAISFEAYSAGTASAGKAVEDMDLATLEDNGFTVYARENKTAGYATFMDGVAVAWDTDAEPDAWKTTEIYYYPTTGSIDFLAIGNTAAKAASVSAVANTAASDAMTFSYTTAATAAAQQDLVYDYVATQSTGAVALTFQHALSQLSATVAKKAGTDENLDLTINSITFTSIKPTATFTPATDTWGTTSGTAADLALGLTSNTVTETGTLMIIPQAMTTIKIAGMWKKGDIIVEDFSAAGDEKVVDLTTGTPSWAINTSYTYNLTFEPDVEQVTFTVAETTGWTSAEEDKDVAND